MSTPKRYRCLIMGAAGRDFHDFLTFFRDHPDHEVCAFTATQIPFIDQRAFPRSLAGPDYAADIPIYSEERMPELVRELGIDFVFFAYSDVSHEDLMHKGSLVLATGASFVLLGPKHTELTAKKPVLAVTAVRTGCGKSPLSQFLTKELLAAGERVAVMRHPMPYGDLERQAVQRFGELADLDKHGCTIEEREEYAPYLEKGLPIFAGVDYRRLLAMAEAEADVVLWDGGNNDFSFVKPDLHFAVLDALRPGHERSYYPGETNFLAAHVVIINKVSEARAEDLAAMRERARKFNRNAAHVESDLAIELESPDKVRGKRALVVEDGPTLTHGGMTFGAGLLAAERGGATIVDPRPGATGSIAEIFARYPQVSRVLPAMGYSDAQRAELAATIRASGAEVVVDASPAGIVRLLGLEQPVVRVHYSFLQRSGPPVVELVRAAVARARAR
ncbi:MAG: GTPase [Myxococcales bacterium]|nr:GTPase [Myxococcales bacterium]